MRKLVKYQQPAGPINSYSQMYQLRMDPSMQLNAVTGYNPNLFSGIVTYDPYASFNSSINLRKQYTPIDASLSSRNSDLFSQNQIENSVNIADDLRSQRTQVSDAARKQALRQAKFKEGFGGMISSIGGISGISEAITGITGLMGLRPDEDSTYGLEQGIAKGVQKFGLPGKIAGTVMQALSSLGHATGKNFGTYNEDQAKDVGLGKGAVFLNKALSTVGNLSGFDFLSGKKVSDSYKSKDVDELYGALADTASFIDNMNAVGGKKFAFGQGNFDAGVSKSNMYNNMMTVLNLDTKHRIQAAQNTSRDLTQNWQNTINGLNYQTPGYNRGKEGLKLLSKEELQRIYFSRKQESVETFGDGGKIGIDTNVIPEGALHAHKNNLEEVNPELDEVTEKGIPVIVTDENADYQQVAEIEKEELVLNKSLTDQIEKLWKENTPESMIEAGKLLAVELMENTQDNTEEMLDGND